MQVSPLIIASHRTSVTSTFSYQLKSKCALLSRTSFCSTTFGCFLEVRPNWVDLQINLSGCLSQTTRHWLTQCLLDGSNFVSVFRNNSTKIRFATFGWFLEVGSDREDLQINISGGSSLASQHWLWVNALDNSNYVSTSLWPTQLKSCKVAL